MLRCLGFGIYEALDYYEVKFASSFGYIPIWLRVVWSMNILDPVFNRGQRPGAARRSIVVRTLLAVIRQPFMFLVDTILNLPCIRGSTERISLIP